jgi:UDP-N-acetyl-2-amino-2-deoxyglucuronate dehydrogenase
MLKKILKVSLVGAGRISKNHLDAISKLSNKFEIDYICDINQNVLNELTNSFNSGLLVDDFNVLLNKSNSDLYVLCTPSGLHPKHASLLLEQSKSVLSEKPMATNLIDGIKVLDTLKKYTNARFFTVKQNRFNKTIIKLKEIINSNILGDVFNININVFWTRPQAYYDQASWRGTKELDGGAFLNQASHYFDLLIYLFGDVKSVFSYTKTYKRNIEMEDSGIVAIEFESGSICTVNISMLTYNKNYEGSITVIAENGTIKVGGNALNKFEFFDIENFDENLDDFNYDIKSVYGFGHLKLYESIYDSLINSTENMLEGASGFKSLKLIMAAYESSLKKKIVYINELS